MPWTPNELDLIGRASELRIAGRRHDGSLRRLVTIWAVRVNNTIYVRSVYGPDGGWYKGVQVRHEGHIEAGGITKDVTFNADHDHNDEIDIAYRAKYGNGSAVDYITNAASRSTTLRIEPNG